jgi:hypothetical protein
MAFAQASRQKSFTGAPLVVYGIELDTPSTGAQIYWLLAGNQLALRAHMSKGEGVSYFHIRQIPQQI